MEEIRMVDLYGQYKKIKKDIDEAIFNVIESTSFINGPEVRTFQTNLENYLNVKHVIPCANGTDALQIALMALGLQPGDEVITTDFTFAATVEVIGLLKLKPVLVDVNYDTFTIDVEKIQKAITPKTKAIIPVHLFGQCADMEEIMQLAKANNLYVVEDTAQAIGARYTFKDGTVKHAGTIGDIGTTSFFPSKNLGCYGDGGALFTNNDDLAALCRSIANHGMGERYYYERLGVNSRLDTLQAAVLNIKLKHLDAYNKSRNEAAGFYDNAFKDFPHLEIPFRNPHSTHVFHQYTLKLKKGKNIDLQRFLQTKGIPSMIYYPVPLHTQNAYKTPDMKDEDFEVTNRLCEEVISLPMHTELTLDQLTYICESVKQFFINK